MIQVEIKSVLNSGAGAPKVTESMAQQAPIITVTSNPDYSASYSSLRLWLSCQERWRQVKDLKRERRSGWATVGGSAVHDLTSRWEAEYSHPDQGAE